MEKEKTLDCWETLIIRHCKTLNPKTSIFKRILAKRSGIEAKCISDSFVVDFLCEIAEKYQLISLGEFVNRVSEKSCWPNEGVCEDLKLSTNTQSRMLAVLVHCITFSITSDKFPNYNPPLLLKLRYGLK
jgi:hypothetical protein